MSFWALVIRICDTVYFLVVLSVCWCCSNLTSECSFLFQKWCPFCIFILSVYSSVFHFILVLIFKQTISTERYSLFCLKCFCFLIHLVFKIKPKLYRLSGQQRLGSACASAQSDQGLGFLLTEWLNNIDKQQRTWLGYTDVQDYLGIRYSNMIRFIFFFHAVANLSFDHVH